MAGYRKAASPRKRSVAGQRPHYLDLEEARQLLAEMNIHLSPRQIKRSSDMDPRGKRKLPWFIDPIEGRLKIERNALLRAYFNRQVEAERAYDNLTFKDCSLPNRFAMNRLWQT